MHDESGLLADNYFITFFYLVLKREFIVLGNSTCLLFPGEAVLLIHWRIPYYHHTKLYSHMNFNH